MIQTRGLGRIGLLALLISTAGVPAVAQDNVPKDNVPKDNGPKDNGPKFDAAVPRMDEVARALSANKDFMGSVLVAHDGKILLDKGYGDADLEWQIPNTPTTKFRLGSLTKQFTAASILLLEERGKLNIDDPVKKYMPDAPAAWDRITIYNVLTHTAGIPNFTSFPDYRKSEPFAATPAELVARFKDKPLDFAPGEGWNYSNSGYVLLGYLIEKISGEPYAKFVQDNIFTPLGMKDTGIDSNAKIIDHRASGYSRGKDGIVNAGYIDMTIPFSAGAIYSTTEDLLRWEQGLFGGKVISAASLKKMTTPFKQDYAFGLSVVKVNGHAVINHNGGIEGFNTRMDYYPGDGLNVIVLGNLNGRGPDEIANDLGAVALGQTVVLPTERKKVAVDAALVGRYVGSYRLSVGPVMVISREGDHVFAQLGGQPRLEIFPESDTSFFATNVDAQVNFVSDKDAPASELVLHQGGREIHAPRIDEAALAARVKAGTASSGTEASLRRYIDSLEKGAPNYDDMTPPLANAVRQQLPVIEGSIRRWGALQSVTFKSVDADGDDHYDVRFEHGHVEWLVAPLSSDGKAVSRSFHEVADN